MAQQLTKEEFNALPTTDFCAFIKTANARPALFHFVSSESGEPFAKLKIGESLIGIAKNVPENLGEIHAMRAKLVLKTMPNGKMVLMKQGNFTVEELPDDVSWD